MRLKEKWKLIAKFQYKEGRIMALGRKGKLLVGWLLLTTVFFGGFWFVVYLTEKPVPIRQMLFLAIGLMGGPGLGIILTMAIGLFVSEIMFGLEHLFSKLIRGFREMRKKQQGGVLR